jgi:hypothetical protein
LAGEVASFRHSAAQGYYVGGWLGLHGEGRRWAVRAMMPTYYLVRDAKVMSGIGDFLLQGRASAFQWRRQSLGAVLGATLPSGRVEDGLGMGHVMLMPGLWWHAPVEKWRFFAEAGMGLAIYGKNGQHGTDHDAHTHQHGAYAGADERAIDATSRTSNGVQPRPLVNPMNAREISGRGEVEFRPTAFWGVRAGIFGAVPVIEEGITRVVSSASLALYGPYYGLDFSLHVPVAGAPFTVKGAVQASLRF